MSPRGRTEQHVQRSETRFLTTHTGSLIRPDTVVREPAPDAGAATRAAYERALTAAVADVAARQLDIGLDVHEWEWEVWERTKLPDGKILIPGVITHHTTTVEHPRLVAQRLERFARIVGPENV